MDEREAWRNFCSTGKIGDYLKYAEIKNLADIPQGINVNQDVDTLGVENNGDKDRRNCY